LKSKWIQRENELSEHLNQVNHNMKDFESFLDQVLEKSENTLDHINKEKTGEIKTGSPLRSSPESIKTPDTVKKIDRAIDLVRSAKKLNVPICSTPNDENKAPIGRPTSRPRANSSLGIPRPKSELINRPKLPPKPLFLKNKPRESSF